MSLDRSVLAVTRRQCGSVQMLGMSLSHSTPLALWRTGAARAAQKCHNPDTQTVGAGIGTSPQAQRAALGNSFLHIERLSQGPMSAVGGI